MSEHTIIIDLKNERPVDVADFATALSAISDQFKRAVAEQGGVGAEARLFIHEIRPGSVVTELFSRVRDMADLYDAFDKVSEFAGFLFDAFQAVLHLTPKAKELDRATIRNVADIAKPIAMDTGGAAMTIIDNRGGTIINSYSMTPMEGAAIRHNANHLLNSQFPDEIRFENEPMILFQMRNAPPGKTGDYGVIDRFSAKERKLVFAGDAVKDAVLHHDGNPFDQTFWVDGVVKTAGGAVVSYLITRLVDSEPRGG